MYKNKLYYIAIFLVLIVFQISYGLDIVVPTNIRWLMEIRHDWGTHYLGWAFYRDAPWTFPLGAMDNYNYPSGTNIGFTDSMVLPALLLKPFSGILPDDFQYLGAWLLFCHLMAAHFTIRIMELYKVKAIYVILAVLFIACNPIMIYRGMHPPLCAHGFILASIYYYLKPATQANVFKINRSQILLTLSIALLSPYMWLMVVGFSLILPFKHWFYDKVLTLKKALLYAGIAVFGSLILWYIVGMVGFGADTDLEVQNSYGLYAFNLNSFINGGGFAVFFPQMPWENPMQYEGYLYLGIGLMILILLSVIYFVATGKVLKFIKSSTRLLPLFLLTLAMTLFAITHKVTYGDKVLLEIPLPDIMMKIGNTFRSSGRFIWVFYYVIFVFVILVFVKSRFPDWAKATIMAVLLVLQFYDVKNIYTFRDLKYGGYDTPLDEAQWNTIIPHYERMITFPPFDNHLLKPMAYQDLCYLAVKNHKQISMGYVGRENVRANKTYTDSLTAAIGNSELLDNELYITTPQHLSDFSSVINQNAMQLDYLDGYYLLYHKKKGVGARFRRDAIAQKKLDSVKNIYSGTKFLKIIDKPESDTGKVLFNVENLSVKDNFFRIEGWAFIESKSNNKGDSLYITVSDNNKTYIANATQVARTDLASAYKKENLESSGFKASIFTTDIVKGEYTIGVAIKEPGDKWTFVDLGDLGKVEKHKKPVRLEERPVLQKQMGNIDELVQTKKDIKISGWSAFEDSHSDDNEIQVVFMQKELTFAVPVKKVIRQDVTAAHKNKYRYDNSGFTVTIDSKDLKKGKYTLGILLKNSKKGRTSLMQTNKNITIQ